MKITEVRTRVVQWKGATQKLPPHFCTNPMDLIAPLLSPETMGSFAFHGWLIVEVFTDKGIVGIGNAALAPLTVKQLIDRHLAPLLIGQDPWDTEFLCSTCTGRRWRSAVRGRQWRPSPQSTSRCGT